MYKRILVPLDGSKLAEQVLPYVRVLAKTCQVPIILLKAFDLIHPPSTIRPTPFTWTGSSIIIVVMPKIIWDM